MENGGIEDVTQRLGDNLNELREELGARTADLRAAVGNFVDAKPLTAIGIAFGVGYLLSGALFSRTTLRAATIGGRFAFGGLLKQLVAGIGPGMIIAAMSGGAEQHDGGASRKSSGGKGNGNGEKA
jgi:hypothetical protein